MRGVGWSPRMSRTRESCLCRTDDLPRIRANLEHAPDIPAAIEVSVRIIDADAGAAHALVGTGTANVSHLQEGWRSTAWYALAHWS